MVREWVGPSHWVVEGLVNVVLSQSMSAEEQLVRVRQGRGETDLM